MKYLKGFELFKEAQVAGQPTSASSVSASSEIGGQQRKIYYSEPKDYKEFEEKFVEYIKDNGGLESESNSKIVEGAHSLFGIVLSSILSGGKLLEIIGQCFRHLVNWAKRIGIIGGEKWKSTYLEKWGIWYSEFLMNWIFKPISKILCQSMQPFLHMVESMFNKGELTNYCTEEDISGIAGAVFYITLAGILTISVGPLGGAITTLIIGKLKVYAVLKTVLSGVKIWEVKHYIMAMFLKKIKQFQSYSIEDIAHGLTDCHEEHGINSSIYYDFTKFNKTKIYDCLLKNLEHH